MKGEESRRHWRVIHFQSTKWKLRRKGGEVVQGWMKLGKGDGMRASTQSMN